MAVAADDARATGATLPCCCAALQIRFGCIPPEGAASFQLDRQLKVQSTYPDKLVVMSEVGYPGPPETYNDAPDGAPCQSANKQIQLTVMDQTLTAVSRWLVHVAGSCLHLLVIFTGHPRPCLAVQCRDSGQGCILFSGANEPWKGNIEGVRPSTGTWHLRLTAAQFPPTMRATRCGADVRRILGVLLRVSAVHVRLSAAR